MPNSITSHFDELSLEHLVHIRSFLDGDAEGFSRACSGLAVTDSTYRTMQATRLLNAAENDTSILARLIQPLASLDRTTRAGICEFNRRVIQAIHSLGVPFPTNRVVEAADLTRVSQEVEDRALVTIWPTIYFKILNNPLIDLDSITMPDQATANAQTIRAWMEANATTLQQVNELDLSNIDLSCVPREIGLLVNLTNLNLSNNQFTTLPESFGQLANLQYLNLDGNQLTTLPESFGGLANLHWLELNHNQLTRLPNH